MTGKVVFHIGLPKTATTTLQSEVFPDLVGDDVVYVGVLQPRENNEQPEMYCELYEAIDSGLGLDKARRRLVDSLESDKQLILSEEMILVSGERSSWREKLSNLSRLLEGLEYVLLVTVRDPVAGLFSYYLERFSQLPERYKDNFLDCALKDEAMEIFHYGKLSHELLTKFDAYKVKVIAFEDVVGGGVDGIVCELMPGVERSNKKALGKYNQKGRKDGVVTLCLPVSVKDVLGERFSRFLVLEKPPFAKARARFNRAVSRIGNKQLFKQSRSVGVPTREDELVLRQALSHETEQLRTTFGIDYG